MHALLADASNAAAATAGGFFIFLIVLLLLYAALWLYCLFNAATRPDFTTSQRLIWILVLIFLHGFGPLIYLIFARRNIV
jgi:hypothetical protein